jgi:hypothetical protein
MAPGNLQKLQDAGLVDDIDQQPEEYREFLGELSEDEVETLVKIKRRLDKAGIPVHTLRPPHVAMPIL